MLVAVNVLWLFLTVLWVGLQCVIVVFPDHTHLLFDIFFGLMWFGSRMFATVISR